MKKTTIVGGVILVLVLLGLAGALERSSRTVVDPLEDLTYATTTVTSGEVTITAEVADTDALRIQGLSNRKSLDEGMGMLFVFPEDDFYGFWMKDMRFSIDIIGFDARKRVVWLQKYVAPWSYPEVFTPPRPVRYVLEVKSGTADALGFSQGQQFDW